MLKAWIQTLKSKNPVTDKTLRSYQVKQDLLVVSLAVASLATILAFQPAQSWAFKALTLSLVAINAYALRHVSNQKKAYLKEKAKSQSNLNKVVDLNAFKKSQGS